MGTNDCDKEQKYSTIVDRDFKILETNALLFSELRSSLDSAEGKNFFEFVPAFMEKKLHSEMCQTLLDGVTHSGEMEVTTANGEVLCLSYTCRPNVKNSQINGIIFNTEDITKRKRQEEQLAIQEKMGVLGQLAASIAHEINNPLEAILNRIGCLLMEDFHEGGIVRLRKELELVQEQVYQISSTTNALIAFSKESKERFRTVNINSIVEKSVELCRLYHPKPGIRIDVELETDLPNVFGSEIGLEQCVVNIINNSIEAINSGGIIKAETLVDLNDENYVKIIITDDGKGIHKENLDKIFEPFFSTKGTAHGSGLGLAISYGIVADHGGIIEVDSEIDKGTTMTISIPKIDKDVKEMGE